MRVNDLCGKKLGLPVWWINGWGPPGDISVRMAGLPGSAPACAFTKKGCGARGSFFVGLIWPAWVDVLAKETETSLG